ncbi:type II toxin-antitoxin system HigB family toxin [Pseudomonas extremorientalis]|uniref:type II toxin-antitoxin system HigB family toxin n=1 Tax=Pseudomonas extremorientalis TaxID=169669 RepID=UPI0027350A9D|nr:type II toxin-antitoxin system HigB family toxin [Pseudomonas extremorientalis]WLG57351.1 type II toxin-antitoxin system HigB family toxin [Pseudomonas extremorientalis]
MRVISEKRIWEAKEKWPQSATALDQWYRIMKRNFPKDFAAMKAMFPSADKVGEFHVFDIGGNKLRLIAVVEYRAQRVYIKHLLDHRDYEKDKWKEKNR